MTVYSSTKNEILNGSSKKNRPGLSMIIKNGNRELHIMYRKKKIISGGFNSSRNERKIIAIRKTQRKKFYCCCAIVCTWKEKKKILIGRNRTLNDWSTEKKRNSIAHDRMGSERERERTRIKKSDYTHTDRDIQRQI